MSLAAQLEALRLQRAELIRDSHGGSSQSVEVGEFSFLRRKLAQFRSGKWRRSHDGSSMVRSQSWNHGLHSTGKLQSEWSSSLTSLRENEVSEPATQVQGRTQPPLNKAKDKDKKKKVKDKEDKNKEKKDKDNKLTRSQSVNHKVTPPEVVIKHRRASQEGDVRERKRPVSFAGLSQFYSSLRESEDTEPQAPDKPLAASCERLVDNEDLPIRTQEFVRLGLRRSMQCIPSVSSVSAKIFRKYSGQNETTCSIGVAGKQ